MKLLIFTTVFAFILLASISLAYELNCDIAPLPYKSSELLTTKAFYPNITFTNIGNNTFPETTVNVTIFNPNHELPESYYSFIYHLENLTINESKSYIEPWFDPLTNISGFALFELQTPGTWEIRVSLLNLPQNEITLFHSEYINSIGRCQKYFSVKEFSLYQKEQSETKILEDTKILTEDTRNLTRQVKELTVSLIFLTLVLVLISLKDIIKIYRDYIVFCEGILLGAYLFIYNADYTLLSLILFAASVILLLKSKNREGSLYSFSLIILFAVITFFNLFFISTFVNSFDSVPIFYTIFILLALLPLMSFYYLFKEKRGKD